jgi:protein-S-isoprenylcysteine O-methyltransferase Ste14
MPAAALALYGLLLFLAFGVRIAIQLRRTGASGLHGLGPGTDPLELFVGAIFGVGLAAGAIAPVLALRGSVEPIAALDGAAGHLLGIVLATTGVILVFSAQLAMGDAWRIGVDPGERTELVTDGPFRLVRNPIYSAILPTVLGFALMVPSPVALIALVLLATGLELQVRAVEEPYLLRTHGEAYESYAARVGRFVPGVGLLRRAQ